MKPNAPDGWEQNGGAFRHIETGRKVRIDTTDAAYHVVVVDPEDGEGRPHVVNQREQAARCAQHLMETFSKLWETEAFRNAYVEENNESYRKASERN